MAFKIETKIENNKDNNYINWGKPQLLKQKGLDYIYLYNPTVGSPLDDFLVDEGSVVFVTLIHSPHLPNETGTIYQIEMDKLEPFKDNLNINFEYHQDND